MIGLLKDLLELTKFLQAQLDRASRLDQQVFSQFVQPIWDTFRQVHADYIATFGDYLAYAASADFEVSELIRRIERDSLAASAERADVVSAILSLRASVKIEARSPAWGLNGFIAELEAYFALPTYLPLAFNEVGAEKWLILASGRGGLYRNHPAIWRVSANNVDAINTLRQIALSDGKKKVYISDYIPDHMAEHRNDFYFIKLGDGERVPAVADQEAREWCRTVFEAASDPYSNAPRVAVLSFIELSNDDGTHISPWLRQVVRHLQEHFNDASRMYYSLRLEVLG